MELTCKVDGYYFKYGCLHMGDTTVEMDIPEETKQQMLLDHPGWFEVVKDSKAPAVKPVESELIIETPEDKMPKLRKK